MLIQVVTTNRNRVVGEFRHLMSKNGGNLAEAGAVGWMFSRKGEIFRSEISGKRRQNARHRLEAGAEDMKDDGSAWYIVTPPEALEKVKEALVQSRNYSGIGGDCHGAAELRQVDGRPGDSDGAAVEALEEHDDVQHVYANFDIDESEIQAAVGAN